MNSCQNQDLIFHSLVVLSIPDNKLVAFKQFNEAKLSRARKLSMGSSMGMAWRVDNGHGPSD
jgi:hypothetical protein